MSEKIVEFNVEIIRGQIKELVRGSVEETQNELLEKEMELLAQAVCCECSEIHQSYRSGRYDWLLHHNHFAGVLFAPGEVILQNDRGDVTLHSCGSGTCPSKQLSQGIAVSGENGAALLF